MNKALENTSDLWYLKSVNWDSCWEASIHLAYNLFEELLETMKVMRLNQNKLIDAKTLFHWL